MPNEQRNPLQEFQDAHLVAAAVKNKAGGNEIGPGLYYVDNGSEKPEIVAVSMDPKPSASPLILVSLIPPLYPFFTNLLHPIH